MSRAQCRQNTPSKQLDSNSQEQLTRLGARIAHLRAAQGLGLTDLAKASGVTAARMKKIEEGAGRLEASLLYVIVQSLNVGVADLFGEMADLGQNQLDPETRDLMRLFSAIQDASIRRSILKLAKALSEKP